MPYFSKKVLSRYIRTECKRQLRLNLSPDNKDYRSERIVDEMPPEQPPRPGMEHMVQAGEEWEATVVHDLTRTFPAGVVIGDSYTHASGQTRYRPIPLESALTDAPPGAFLIEAQYEVGNSFEHALHIEHLRLDHDLAYSEVRPDITVVLPARHFDQYVTPAGDVLSLPHDDARAQLRVIDIKLTAEPSPSYFAEVAYYTMTLAGWLIDHGLDSHFVVVPNGAIWSGSHSASNLVTTHQALVRQGAVPQPQQLQDAMEQDLELVPFEVFAFRIHRFLHEELAAVLTVPWQELDWHVDNRCKGCEYLGYPWVDKDGNPTSHADHCMPMAVQRDHLSRVAFISRGASSVLRDLGVDTVASLAQTSSTDAVFDSHQILRATRTVVSQRAVSLETQQSGIPPAAGTSAVMPRWTDLRIYLSVDFDLGSAITFAFGAKAFWLEPRDYGSDASTPRDHQAWAARTFVVDEKDLRAEQRELLAFLDHINHILETAHGRDGHTTVQFYLWDSLQYEHLTRVIGRHLQTILNHRTLRHLAWLFPPEEVLPNPRLATRNSPITIVRDAIRAVLAAPVAHYYSLFQITRVYHNDELPEHVAQFSIHPLFEDILSDQIPSERAHEIWSRSTHPRRHWQQRLRILEETVAKRLGALEAVTRRLEADLRQALIASAPRINIGPPERQTRLSVDGQLWYAFAKLNEAIAELETHQIRAMPPHEREARFHSARLEQQLFGVEENAALAQLNLQPKAGRRVYRMRPNSREVKIREGDFDHALAPEEQASFLDQTYHLVTRGTPLEFEDGRGWRMKMEDVMGVTVAAVDRENLLIALDPNRRWPNMLDGLEAHGLADFTTNVTLDPVHHDYFTNKLLAALKAIGNPAQARNDPLVRRATGQTGRGSRQTPHTPPADLLWGASEMYETSIARTLQPTRAVIEQYGLDLNASQWQAWEAALSRRHQLIWGPPGTGKSRTAKAVVIGAALEAHQEDKPIRILICTPTYRAMDIILLDVYAAVGSLLSEADCEVWRLRSYLRAPDPSVPKEIDVELNRASPSEDVVAIRERLTRRNGITIVGATPSQIHNLMTACNGSAQQELFDLILIDEASQMDVANAILAFCSLADDGSVVLAGDPKQLPPIHQAEAPLGLEAMVGCIYSFCEKVHGVGSEMLEVNYRSNSTLVEFSLSAGYRPALKSYSPDLKLNLVAPLPFDRPANWPCDLFWTPAWSLLLDPNRPAVCFVYPEGRSSQWNQFEADAVAALLFLLQGRTASQLLNELDPTEEGAIVQVAQEAYQDQEFWTRAVGVVTPHRAQQGLIVSRLQQVFADTGVDPATIRDAVDTVERFQGQQRDVIVASYALGDPDAIHDEDEFLMSLNRFNVMASRARAKLVLLVSQEVVDHLSSDLDTLRESRLLKVYVESFCRNGGPITLGFMEGGAELPVPGIFRYREA